MLWGAGSLFATHNRAGEITYTHVSGLTYEFTITTYTNSNTAAISRNFLQINWGDGSADSIPRISDDPIPGVAQQQTNIYVGQHTYAGPGEFTIWMEDKNRNADVSNIPLSVNQAFYIETELIIIPGFQGNNSVQLLNPPLDRACTGELFIHNPAAYDPDGDSLVYTIAASRGNGGLDIAGYTFPNPILTVDRFTGDMVWNAPNSVGEYNVAMLIEEYRNGTKIGSVLRDLQIDVSECDNTPPVIDDIPDTCVIAGTFLTIDVTATDLEGGTVSLEAFGAPFTVANPASFPTVSGTGTTTGTFEWSVLCNHVQLNPHLAVFKASDVGDVNLTDMESMHIQVIAPEPTNLTAVPAGNTISLNWDTHPCSNSTAYKVYRRKDFYGYTPAHCETGVPDYTGYELIANVDGHANSSYIDANDLIHGNIYCYMIVACFEDGAESIASQEVCTQLIKDVPVITNVSVGITSIPSGVDTVMWSKASELDSVVQWPGPYHYKVYHSYGFAEASTLVHTTPASAIMSFTDTMFIHTGINTGEEPSSYRIELYSGTDLVGTTLSAPSIFLTTTPNDNRLTLNWNNNTPWTNTSHEIYWLNEATAQFELVTIADKPTYTVLGLANGEKYCYRIKTVGAYSATTIASPLHNYSQIACGIPTDLTPPCPPTLAINENCEGGLNTLVWTNPNHSCADDVLSYEVYYAPLQGQDLELVATLNSPFDTTLEHSNNGSVAGCYAIIAIDSVGNRSAFSNEVCVDNCPYFELPNVFTPNNDGVNDAFQALDIRNIESIELTILNRWGQEVYKTTDPGFQWSGMHLNARGPVPTGTYFYVCGVNEIRLSGIVRQELKGIVTVLYEKGSFTIR